MRQHLCAAAMLSALAMPSVADNYTIDPLYTVPAFEVTHLGFTTQSGRFNKVSGNISLDFPAKKGSVELTIYTASIDMGTPAWSAHLMDEGLLNADKFPTMSFRSQKLVFAGDKVVAAEGEFTLLGVTRPLRVSVSRFRCLTAAESKKTVCGADVTANMKRSDFGLNKYIPEVSDEIHIRVPLEAYKN